MLDQCGVPIHAPHAGREDLAIRSMTPPGVQTIGNYVVQ